MFVMMQLWEILPSKGFTPALGLIRELELTKIRSSDARYGECTEMRASKAPSS